MKHGNWVQIGKFELFREIHDPQRIYLDDLIDPEASTRAETVVILIDGKKKKKMAIGKRKRRP